MSAKIIEKLNSLAEYIREGDYPLHLDKGDAITIESAVKELTEQQARIAELEVENKDLNARMDAIVQERCNATEQKMIEVTKALQTVSEQLAAPDTFVEPEVCPADGGYCTCGGKDCIGCERNPKES